ncbi:MAG: histidine kinase [Proteobacteria bacterium]|nr:histidine kinase [Pseudomonadota bacterium]
MSSASPALPPAPAVPPGASLEAPLPAELAGRHQGWLTRYRRYPVYSAPWARGRLRSVGLLVLVALLVLLSPAMLIADQPESPTPLGGLAEIAIVVLLPLWLGPRLAQTVRRRHWGARREWLGLVAAQVLSVLAVLAFAQWGSEPLKQWVAEQRGSVDAQGKRKRVVMSLGLSVTDPNRAEPPLISELDGSFAVKVSNAVSVALAAFLLGGGAGLWAWRREREGLAGLARERELTSAQARRREAELRLSVLAAQVEPHFLFNTLAGVRSAIATDPQRASEMVDGLVDYLRAAIPRLRSDGAVQATLGAQLDIVRAYLGLMAARMPRLQWRVQAPPELLAARCPPLMLISLAENAVKHGVERKIGPALIEVQAGRDEQGRLRITVADDGAGFAASGSGIGLANLGERLAQLYPGQAELLLKARPEGGVLAGIVIPLELDA